MAEGAAQQGEAGRKSQTRAIVIIGSLVIVALVGVIVALVMVLLRDEPEPQPVSLMPEQRSVIVNEDNAEEVIEEIVNAPAVAPGYYEASMTTDWTFPNGTSASPDSFVENVATNTNDVFFDIQLRSTRETIYKSPVIPLGSYLRNIRLDTALDAGTYPCVMIYHLVDENQVTLSTLSVGLTIIVEN